MSTDSLSINAICLQAAKNHSGSKRRDALLTKRLAQFPSHEALIFIFLLNYRVQPRYAPPNEGPIFSVFRVHQGDDLKRDSRRICAQAMP